MHKENSRHNERLKKLTGQVSKHQIHQMITQTDKGLPLQLPADLYTMHSSMSFKMSLQTFQSLFSLKMSSQKEKLTLLETIK